MESRPEVEPAEMTHGIASRTRSKGNNDGVGINKDCGDKRTTSTPRGTKLKELEEELRGHIDQARKQDAAEINATLKGVMEDLYARQKAFAQKLADAQ